MLLNRGQTDRWGQSQLTEHSPKVLALAAAEQTDQEGNDENSTNHCQGDNQRLEVHCGKTHHRVMPESRATYLLLRLKWKKINKSAE